MNNLLTKKTIQLVIVDDHSLFRAGVKTALSENADIDIIAEADNGMQLLDLLKSTQPDVILLDVQMPALDGVATLQEIRKLYPAIKVIMLSMHSDLNMISHLMEIGANSYIPKNSDAETIYKAIRTCYEQEFFFTELTNKALLAGLRTRKDEFYCNEEIPLSDRETRILKLICQEKTTKEIAALEEISPRTVEAIRDKLKVKTGSKSMAGLAIYAIKYRIIAES